MGTGRVTMANDLDWAFEPRAGWPRITAIEVVRRGAVRRAKLYYLRGRRGKSARIAERARDDNRRERGAAAEAEA